MSKQTVLIVEDDPWLAEQHARVLTKAGYKTSISPHAEAAIDAVDDVHPDVIVLDMLLTGSTAFALMHELQSYGDTSVIPIILCTNLAADMNLDDVKPYGVQRMLDKTSMLPDDVVTAVRSVL
ncbi:MAG: response regulator BaeR [Candidatus Saccharibacteria bacterium]|nr:response regulator BaeR [Candidatus Saccharibacteria bacterium]